MMQVTQSAVERLKALVLEHPEDPVVRIEVKDLDDHRLTFSITLEDRGRRDDETQTVDGLTMAVVGSSAARLDGVTLDYRELDGFIFHHAAP